MGSDSGSSTPNRGGLDVRKLVELPFQLGFAVTGVTLTAAESALNIARLTTSNVQYEVNHALGMSDDELANVRAPLALLAQLAELLGPDRPFGRIIASGGPLERLLVAGGVIDRLTATDGLLEKLTAPSGILDRMTEDNGILERLTSEGGIVDKLTAPDGVLDKLTAPGGVLDRAAEDDGLLDQLLGAEGAVERAIAPGGPLDRITELTEVIGQLAPSLVAMQDTVHELSATVELLNQTVSPLGGLADRLPKRLTRAPKGPAEAVPPHVAGRTTHRESP
ncbi:hypothetical protein [Gordonia sp. NPDC003376]